MVLVRCRSTWCEICYTAFNGQCDCHPTGNPGCDILPWHDPGVSRSISPKFGLPPTDCAENPSPACFGNTGGYIFLEPHLGNQNYGQYSTYYPPLNLGGGNGGGGGNVGGGGSGIISTIVNSINNISKGVLAAPSITPNNNVMPVASAPFNVNDLVQRGVAFVKANPISLAVGGGIAYLIFKGGK